MKYYADIDVNGFVKTLHTPHDENIPVIAVEITAEAYTLAIGGADAITDYKVSGTNLVLDTTAQADTILKEVKDKKKKEIRVNFEADAVAPVLHNGINYNGGIDSVYRLDGALRLIEKAGLAEVSFTDVDNVPHVHTITEANAAILAVGVAFQDKFMNKQGALVNINKAKTVDAVNLINY